MYKVLKILRDYLIRQTNFVRHIVCYGPKSLPLRYLFIDLALV